MEAVSAEILAVGQVLSCDAHSVVLAVAVGILVHEGIDDFDELAQLNAVIRHIEPVGDLLHVHAQVDAQVLDPVIAIVVAVQVIAHELEGHARQEVELLVVLRVQGLRVQQRILVIVLNQAGAVLLHHLSGDGADQLLLVHPGAGFAGERCAVGHFTGCQHNVQRVISLLLDDCDVAVQGILQHGLAVAAVLIGGVAPVPRIGDFVALVGIGGRDVVVRDGIVCRCLCVFPGRIFLSRCVFLFRLSRGVFLGIRPP